MRLPLTFLTLFLLTTGTYAQNPRAPHELRVNDDAHDVNLATFGKTSMAIWHESSPEYKMYSVASFDQGMTWSTSSRVDDSPGALKLFPVGGLAMDDEKVVTVWNDKRNSSATDLYFSKSTNAGANWSSDLLLDKGFPSGANPVLRAEIGMDGQEVAVVVRTEEANGDASLFLVRSRDGGDNWTNAIDVTYHNDQCDISDFDMVVKDGKVHILWIDNFDYFTGSGSRFEPALWYSAYTISSGSFSPSNILLSPQVELNSNWVGYEPDLQVRGDDILATFSANTGGFSFPWEIRSNVSTDGGTTWSGDTKVGNYDSASGDWANSAEGLILDSREMLIVWADDRNGLARTEIFLAKSSPGGANFIEHSTPLGFGFHSSIIGDGDYIAVAQTGGFSPSFGAQLSVSRDGGNSFGSPVDITSGQIGSHTMGTICFNLLYQNFLASWRNNPSGGLFPHYVGGLRMQTLAPSGPFTAGSSVNFRANNFGIGETGYEFVVVASPILGSTAIQGDGRDIFLGMTPTLIASYLNPALKATLSSQGAASTPLVTFPASFPVGTTLYFVGVARSPWGFGSVTDVISVVIS